MTRRLSIAKLTRRYYVVGIGQWGKVYADRFFSLASALQAKEPREHVETYIVCPYCSTELLNSPKKVAEHMLIHGVTATV